MSSNRYNYWFLSFVCKQWESIFKLSIPSQTIQIRNCLKLVWLLPCNLLPFSPALISTVLRPQLLCHQCDCSWRQAGFCIRQSQSSHSGNKHPTLMGRHRSPTNCFIILFCMEEPESKRHPNPSRRAEQVLTAWYWSRRWHQDQAHLLQQNYCSQCQPEYLTAETEERRGGFHIQLNKQTNKKSLKFLSKLPSVSKPWWKLLWKWNTKCHFWERYTAAAPSKQLIMLKCFNILMFLEGEKPTKSIFAEQVSSQLSQISFWSNTRVLVTWHILDTGWIAYFLKHCLS